MVATDMDRFTSAVRGVGAAVTRTTAAEFDATLTEAVREPAIGTDLLFDGLSYEGTPVTTEPTGGDLRAAATGVTPAALGIADYGSVVLQDRGDGAELLGLYPDRHVVVVAASAVVPDMSAAFETLDDGFDSGPRDAIVATGPSATADMGAVVTGVHGPRDVHVVVLEDR